MLRNNNNMPRCCTQQNICFIFLQSNRLAAYCGVRPEHSTLAYCKEIMLMCTVSPLISHHGACYFRGDMFSVVSVLLLAVKFTLIYVWYLPLSWRKSGYRLSFILFLRLTFVWMTCSKWIFSKVTISCLVMRKCLPRILITGWHLSSTPTSIS